MPANLYHLQLNVADVAFYRDFLTALGYTIDFDDGQIFRASGEGTELWINWVERKFKSYPFHRKTIGLNHLAFQVDSRRDVDEFVENFLKRWEISPLYHSPRSFPQYGAGYCAVYFEDPSRIKLVVMTKASV